MGTVAKEQGWQLAGSSAEAYERFLVGAIFRSSAARLVEAVGVRSGERVLDVGCGTGIVARTAAPVVGPSGRVAGVDINADMLDVARRESSELEPSIEWREASAADLPFGDGSFDVVCSEQALAFFTDPAAAVAEMRRVLVPGGRLGLLVCRDVGFNPAWAALADALERHVGSDPADGMRSPFSFGDGEAIRELVMGAGFDGVRVLADIAEVRYPSADGMLRYEAASSPMAGAIAALDAEVREALIADLNEGLAPYADDAGIAVCLQCWKVLASA